MKQVILGTMIAAASVMAAEGPLADRRQAGARRVAPGDPGWQFSGDVAAGTHMGRPALRFGTGEAYLPDVRFERGTIAFDLATSPIRTFFGLRFRAESTGAFEEIYLRPHKSGLPDALQYAPAFGGGRSSWQLFHGPGETAAAVIDHSTWTRVRVVIDDARAAVFLAGATEPQMVVHSLVRDAAAGFIGFWALDASAARGPGHRPTGLSNLSLEPDLVDITWPEPPSPAPAPVGLITSWDVSQPFAAPAAGPVTDLPAEVVSGPWTAATTLPTGLLVFDRVVAWPDGQRRVTALARTRLRAASPRVAQFQLGFSDDASVFLNGRLVYAGVNGYSYNFPRRDGVITIDQATLFLPLAEGDNELVVAVSDSFGGWGLMGRIEGPAPKT